MVPESEHKSYMTVISKYYIVLKQNYGFKSNNVAAVHWFEQCHNLQFPEKLKRFPERSI